MLDIPFVALEGSENWQQNWKGIVAPQLVDRHDHCRKASVSADASSMVESQAPLHHIALGHLELTHEVLQVQLHRLLRGLYFIPAEVSLS